MPVQPGKEPEKHDPGCMAGCGTGSKKKKKGSTRDTEEPQIRRDPVEGVELLWQPEMAKSYLSIMAEAANPETLEGSAGAIHNLTACGWRVCVPIVILTSGQHWRPGRGHCFVLLGKALYSYIRVAHS